VQVKIAVKIMCVFNFWFFKVVRENTKQFNKVKWYKYFFCCWKYESKSKKITPELLFFFFFFFSLFSSVHFSTFWKREREKKKLIKFNFKKQKIKMSKNKLTKKIKFHISLGSGFISFFYKWWKKNTPHTPTINIII